MTKEEAILKIKKQYTPQIDEQRKQSIIDKKWWKTVWLRICRLRGKWKYRGAYIAEKEFITNWVRDTFYEKMW